MRVITYVPPVHGADRTRRSIERDVRRRGHEIVGHTSSRTEAQAALNAGVADMIAGRPDHLLDLAPWALGVTSRAEAAKGAAIALPIWAATQARRHPGRTATVAGAVAGLAAAVVFAMPDSERPTRPRVLPPAPPSATSLYWGPGIAPPAPTLAPATPTAPPVAPTRPPSRRAFTGPQAGAGPSRPPEPTARQTLSPRPSAPALSPTAPTRPPAAPSTEPRTVPAPAPPGCIISLDSAVLDIQLCLT